MSENAIQSKFNAAIDAIKQMGAASDASHGKVDLGLDTGAFEDVIAKLADLLKQKTAAPDKLNSHDLEACMPPPAPPAFDRPTVEQVAKLVVGLPLEEAKKIAAKNGIELRVAEEDGRPLELTKDYRSNRYNVIVKDGEVTSVVSNG